MTDKKYAEIFARLSEPFPKAAYKEVTFGRHFTTIDAYYIVARLTEIFSLCGQGWGVHIDEYKIHGSGIAAFGYLWYVIDGTRYEVPSVGDAQIIKDNIAEAYKKASTNLISKASSFLGVGLSVYQGRGIDDPYLDRAHTESTTKTSILDNLTTQAKSEYIYDVTSEYEGPKWAQIFKYINEAQAEISFDVDIRDPDGSEAVIVTSRTHLPKLKTFEVK